MMLASNYLIPGVQVALMSLTGDIDRLKSHSLGQMLDVIMPLIKEC